MTCSSLRIGTVSFALRWKVTLGPSFFGGRVALGQLLDDVVSVERQVAGLVEVAGVVEDVVGGHRIAAVVLLLGLLLELLDGLLKVLGVGAAVGVGELVALHTALHTELGRVGPI